MKKLLELNDSHVDLEEWLPEYPPHILTANCVSFQMLAQHNKDRDCLAVLAATFHILRRTLKAGGFAFSGENKSWWGKESKPVLQL